MREDVVEAATAGLPESAIRAVVDARGDLVAVEHGELPFTPARTFVVTSQHAPVCRGGHVTGCRQVLVLVRGRVTLRVGRPDGSWSRVELAEPGTAVLLSEVDHVDYWLEEPATVLLVLAERPFQARDVAVDRLPPRAAVIP